MTIVIGAGPAGLAAALALKAPALILERNAYAGKKLLLSGNGQCNLSNTASTQDFLQRLAEFRTWLKPAYYQFSNHDLMQLLEDAGCALYRREDGKVFPKSKHSAEIRDTLLRLVERKGHSIIYHCHITKLYKQDSGFILRDATGRDYQATHVILAAGGAAYPDTGSDGSGYSLAAQLGHECISPRPALASVKIKDFAVFSTCAGISMQKLLLKLRKKSYRGDLLFTHQGFSGPLILDNAYRMQPDDSIAVVWDENASFESRCAQHSRRKLSSILHMMGLPQALCKATLQHLGIPDTSGAELTGKDRKSLQQWLQYAEFRVQSLAELDAAMSDYGGVALSEVKASTMQSKLVPGLFLAGETLAYSLPTGGYSIQMAMATGYLAGIKVNDSLVSRGF